MTRSEVTKKAWITRRAKEERVADSGTTGAERVGARTRKRPSNPRIDEAIANAYRQWREFGNRTAIRNLAERIGWPRWSVNRRASEMGIAQTKELPWSEREVVILERWGHLTDHGIQTKLAKSGFHRSLTAVHLKVKRLRIKRNLDGYSAHSLSQAFGVDGHVVTKWIARGMLKAERRGTARTGQQNGDTYWITNADVKQFIAGYPNEIDLAKVEKFWFLDLVTDGGISEKSAELARRGEVNALVAAAGESAKRADQTIKGLERQLLAAQAAPPPPKPKALLAQFARLHRAIAEIQGRRVAREDARQLDDLITRLENTLHVDPCQTAAAEGVEAVVSDLFKLAEARQ